MFPLEFLTAIEMVWGGATTGPAKQKQYPSILSSFLFLVFPKSKGLIFPISFSFIIIQVEILNLLLKDLFRRAPPKMPRRKMCCQSICRIEQLVDLFSPFSFVNPFGAALHPHRSPSERKTKGDPVYISSSPPNGFFRKPILPAPDRCVFFFLFSPIPSFVWKRSKSKRSVRNLSGHR